MTNRLKPAMERVARRPREHAGRSVSERRAGLENCNAGADPPFNRGRLPSIGGPARAPETSDYVLPTIPPGY